VIMAFIAFLIVVSRVSGVYKKEAKSLSQFPQ